MSNRDKRNAAACHTMVRDTAVALAHECYDSFMQNNVYYESWQASNPGLRRDEYEKVWVNENWARFIPAARANLAAVLKQPLEQGLKDTIAEALILDATLVRGRKTPAQVLGRQ